MFSEMSCAVKSHFSAVDGFFEHDQEPEGPKFRAVRVKVVQMVLKELI